MAPETPDSGAAGTETHVPADQGATTEALVAGTVGDRCVNCGSPLTSDQRYCVVCGERRGAPRFGLPVAEGSGGGPPSTTAPRSGRSARGPRFSAGTTLVVGVATLLLAVLVGYLIGHGVGSGGTKTIVGAQPKINVYGGGGGGSASGAGSATASTPTQSANTKSKGKHHAATKAAPKASKKLLKKESSAAAKALGGGAKDLPPATVTQGQKGSGPGFNKKTHKFTGQFFGQ